MIQTKIAENYVEGTEQKSGILYVDTNMTSFLNKSNGIVVYLNIGVILTETLTEPDVEVTKHHVLNTKTLNYTQEDLKTMIEATGQDFNSPITNLLIDEINRFSDKIILDDITANPQNYFGLTADKWEEVA